VAPHARGVDSADERVEIGRRAQPSAANWRRASHPIGFHHQARGIAAASFSA
jgi:hypothetical protein